jgi:5'-3' exonuclease
MGIPSYFFEIIKKYGERFFGASKGTRGVGRLFLDLNCCIHGCKNRVLNRWKKSKTSLIDFGRNFEDDIIKEVIRTIVRFAKEVSPSNLLWIAVDGVVPLAKMKQQRERRLRSIQTRDEIRRIYECHERDHPVEWDSNAITPGTSFMIRMCKTIEENLEMIRGCCGVGSIGMNGVENAGEGEQKIFEYMRNHPGDDSGLEDIIYGLDADLIILSILQRTVADQDSPIALLREKVHFGRLFSPESSSKDHDHAKSQDEHDDEMIRFRVSEFADLIPKEWGGGRRGSPTQSLLCDYVILISLMGNDFVPHCPSLTFRTGGMERLIDAYRSVGSHIIVPHPNPEHDVYIINWNVIGDICNILAEDEEKILREDEEKMSKIQERILAGQIPYRHSIVEDPLEQDVLALDWEHIRYHSPIIITTQPQSHTNNWQERFYRRVLGNRGEWSSQKVMLSRMIDEYTSAIQWCWDYYCGYDVPADRYYPFVSGPLMKDIAAYCKKMKMPGTDAPPPAPPLSTPIDPLDIDDDESTGIPGPEIFTVKDITPDVQLIAVLPPDSHHLLSESARKVARQCIDLYPNIFDFWDYCKKHEWEREGYLPMIPIKQIRDLMLKNYNE